MVTQNVARCESKIAMLVMRHVRQRARVTKKQINIFSSDYHRRPFSTTPTEQFDFNPTGPCPVLEWAALPENRIVASDCLDVPSILAQPMSSASDISNWEEYWTYRQWAFPTALKDDTELEYGHTLASHIMCTPMTIYSKIDELLESCDVATPKTSKKLEERTANVKWCCIGARSESSLPIQYWQELIDLIHIRRKLLRRIRPKKHTPKVLNISMDFIGPEMNVNQSPVTLHPTKPIRHEEYDFVNGYNETTSDNYDDDELTTSFTIRWRYKGLYHIYYKEIDPNLNEDYYDKQYNAYILCNPGVGHNHLQKVWQPTLQLIFEQFYRINSFDSCAILLTAHSDVDALRDSQLLQHYRIFADSTNISTIKMNNESDRIVEPPAINYYTENPFASRIYYLDPIVLKGQEHTTKHIIRPNHYVAVFRQR